MGPIMLDLRGPNLEEDEKEALLHPSVGGVILFSRNYQEPDQLRDLNAQIHRLRKPPLLIAVDHEGGRVQRFRSQFTRMPACRLYGQLYDTDQSLSLTVVEKAGWLMASELLSVGIDFSFAPVLDIDTSKSKVIGDRSFHHDCEVVTDLAKMFIKGMKFAGMAPVGKHFPGHGYVSEDSHVAIPIDNRPYQDIMMTDLIPFERLVNSGLAGIMPAHVIYPVIDEKPAGFSSIWLNDVLRTRIGFHGAIFSDDISMTGAEVIGSYIDRAQAALDAGCDMVLVCNNQAEAFKILEDLDVEKNPESQVRLMRMHGQSMDRTLKQLKQDSEWKSVVEELASMEKSPELDLSDDEIHS